MKIEECEEPDVDGTYRRMYEASCREHFVNQYGMHLYYVAVRKEWHIGSTYFGNQFGNLVINADDELFQLPGRHEWRIGLDREDEGDNEGGEDEGDIEGGVGGGRRDSDVDYTSPVRAGELVIKIISRSDYQCS